MIHYHKTVFAFLVMALMSSACAKQTRPDEGAAAAEAHENTAINLTEEQIQFAGIELGQPSRRTMAGFLEYSGMIDAPPSSLRSIHSPVTGFVQQINHYPGQYVRRGELLTSIVHPEFIRMQSSFLESTSQLAFLKKDRKRKAELAEADAASRRAYEQAITDHEMAEAHYKGLKAELDLIGIDTDQLEATRNIQKSIRLFAPTSGYLLQVAANPGMLAEPSGLLFRIADNSHLHLELHAYAKDLPKIKKGQQVSAYIPGGLDTLHGKVYLIGKEVNPENKTINIHVHFDEEPEGLAIGTYLFARIQIQEQSVMAVPEAAVVKNGAQSFIFVKKERGFRKQRIQTGQEVNGYVEVRGLELTEGEQIATKGAYYINGTE